MRSTILLVATMAACDGYTFDPDNLVDAVPTGDTSVETDSEKRTKKDIAQAVDDDVLMWAGASLTFNPTTNDFGRRLSIISVTTPDQGGTVQQLGDRELVYDAAKGFSGTETFEYTIEDRHDDQSTGTVSINVRPLPSIEITAPVSGTEVKGTSAEITFEVTGCALTAPTNDDCHIHMYVDGKAYAFDGAGRGHYDAKPRLMEGLTPGKREIEFRLVVNDGTDAEFFPFISDSVSITVPK